MSEIGPDNFGDLLGQLQRLQEGLESATGASGDQEIEGRAGGGAVRVRLGQDLHFTSVDIDPSVVDTAAVDLLEDLVLAAIRDAIEQFTTAQQARVSSVMSSAFSGMLGLPGQATDDEEDDSADRPKQ